MNQGCFWVSLLPGVLHEVHNRLHSSLSVNASHDVQDLSLGIENKDVRKIPTFEVEGLFLGFQISFVEEYMGV